MLRKPSARGIAGRLVVVLVAGGAVVLALDGCGSRGTLEGSAEVADADTEAAAPEEAGAPEDAAPPDAGREAGGFLACGSCVFETCGQSILACFQSDGCREIFACVASECVGGGGAGGLDPGCLLGCAGSDPASALQVLGVFQCVTQQCGADCNSILGSLGGGGGGRDAGGGRRDAGGDRDAGRREAGPDAAGDEP